MSAANPKDAMAGAKAAMLSVVPAVSLESEAAVMAYGAHRAPRKDGGVGYGPFNWRDTPVKLSVYVDAMMRHMLAYVNGEEHAPDSGEHHLAHLKANCGIILDAAKYETLVDDLRRPLNAAPTANPHDEDFLRYVGRLLAEEHRSGMSPGNPDDAAALIRYYTSRLEARRAGRSIPQAIRPLP